MSIKDPDTVEEFNEFLKDAFDSIEAFNMLYEITTVFYETEIDRNGTVRRKTEVKITSTSDSCSRFYWLIPLFKTGHTMRGFVCRDESGILSHTEKAFHVKDWGDRQAILIEVDIGNFKKGVQKTIHFEHFINNYLLSYRKKLFVTASKYLFGFKALGLWNIIVSTYLPREAKILKKSQGLIEFRYSDKLEIVGSPERLGVGETMFQSVEYTTPTIYTSLARQLIPSSAVATVFGFLMPLAFQRIGTVEAGILGGLIAGVFAGSLALLRWIWKKIGAI